MLIAPALFAITALLGSTQAVGDGYWHTSGNKILDSNNQQVRFSGVNWNGFESGNFVPHGLWGGGRNWKSMLQQMDSLGFNLIRLPFAGETLTPGRMPQNIDYGLNPDLVGKTSLEIMDMIVTECGALGIRIILDYHRVQAGGTPEDGLWFIPGTAHTEQLWIENWKALVARYAGNPTVVGCDLFNEVHAGNHPGPFWSADGTNEPYNWRTAAQRCGDAILSVNPQLLICVQGMHEYDGQTGWWGAVHMGVKDHPLALAVANRLVFSIHDYGPNVWVQPWHNDPAFPDNLFTHWDTQWGFLHDDNHAPVWIGEWGSKLDTTKEIQWATKLRDYIQQKGLSWTWWCWNPNSGDTGGILQDDWTTTHQAKLDLVDPVMYPGFAGSGGGGPPPPPPPTPGQTPYGGTAAAVPGTVEAEDFDEGGEGVAYHDSDATNSGGQYRSTGVDIEACSDAGGGFNVGWLAPTEWLEYTVDIATAGTCSIDFRVASATTGGTFHLEVGGVDITGALTAPGTGGWQTWQSVTATGVSLAAGPQELRLVFDSGSFNLNSMTFTLTAASTPPGGAGAGGGGSGGGSEGDEGCGLLGLEAVLLLVLARRRLRHPVPASPGRM